jgi:HSP20 family molecular chaperone IbpA
MKEKRKFKFVFFLIILMAAVIAAEGYIIYKQSKKDSKGYSADTFEIYSSTLLDKFKHDRQEREDMFDRFFNEDFFSGHRDPFAEMERMHKQLESMMGRQHGGTFNNSWDSWFGNRFLGGSDDIEFQQSEKKNSYEITLKIPNLKENKLDIKIEKEGIAISGEFSQTAEKKGTAGNIVSKSEIHRSIAKNLPIPGDADYQKARVENKEDKIIITIPKKVS